MPVNLREYIDIRSGVIGDNSSIPDSSNGAVTPPEPPLPMGVPFATPRSGIPTSGPTVLSMTFIITLRNGSIDQQSAQTNSPIPVYSGSDEDKVRTFIDAMNRSIDQVSHIGSNRRIVLTYDEYRQMIFIYVDDEDAQSVRLNVPLEVLQIIDIDTFGLIPLNP